MEKITKQEIIHLFSDLKESSYSDFIPMLPVKDESGKTVMYMRPIPATLGGYSEKDAFLMAEWRNASSKYFFSWIKSTEQSERDWLNQAYRKEKDSILLMLETTDGMPFAHFGLMNFNFETHSCEFARGVRGKVTGPKGGMTLAGKTLFRWARHSLGMEHIFAEVLSDNNASLNWCLRLQGKMVSETPLNKITMENGVIKWQKSEDQSDVKKVAEKYSIHVEWNLKELDFCQ